MGIPRINRAQRMVLILLSAVASLSFTTGLSIASDYQIDKYHPGCVMCHRTMTSEYDISVIVAGDSEMSLICMDCHDYGENHHPVNIVPNREIYSGFPLIDGQIKCLTCHEAHGTKQPSYPKMLRGAPYTDRREICFKCHDMNEKNDLNPHVMFDAEGKIRQLRNGPICLSCHTHVPDQSNPEKQVTFKADVAFLCWRCHPPMPGSFFRGHFLVKPSSKTSRYMKKYESSSNVTLPLLNRDRITCSTCHNPHQSGVIDNAAAAAGASAYAKLRLSKKEICYGCHEN